MILDFHGLPAFTVPGLHGSGKNHWQSMWEAVCPGMTRIEQKHWDTPSLSTWSDQVAAYLSATQGPAVLIAHSFGCLASIHAALEEKISIAGAFLVAPAEPAKFGVDAELARGPLPFPSILIASSDDPWLRLDRARNWAGIWGCEFVDTGPLGHINAESDLGLWSSGIALLQRFLDRLPTYEASAIASELQ